MVVAGVAVLIAFAHWAKRLALLPVAVLLGLAVAQVGAGAQTLEAKPAERSTLTLGVFAYLGVEQTRRQYQPLVDYLNATLQREQVVLQVLPQHEIDHGIESGTLDIVTTNPTHFLVVRHRYPLTGIMATRVNEVNGQPVRHLAGVILTRADRTDIQSLQDVRGTRVATPSLLHMGGYRAQAYELHQAGIKLPQDVKAVVLRETHQAVVRAVIAGDVDVGLVREGVLELMTQQGDIRAQDYKVLHLQRHPGFPFQVSTRLYPEWPVFALPHVPDAAVRHVAAALFALEPNNPATQAAGIYGYSVSADYLPVEALARTLRLPPFDQHLDVTWWDIWESWRQGLTIAALALLVILLLGLMLAALARRERLGRLRMDQLMQTLGEGVLGTDERGRVTFVNEAALTMLGRQASDVLHQPEHTLLRSPPSAEEGLTASHAPLGSPVGQTLQDGQTRRGEDDYTVASGGRLPVAYVVSPLRSDAKTVGSVMAFQDIRARKAAEQQMQQVVQALRQTNAELKNTRDQLLQSEKLASIGQLAAGVAHEINNPIAFVGSNLGTLETYLADLLRLAEVAQTTEAGQTLASAIDLPYLRQDAEDLLRECRDGLQRVRKIVLDLRDFSRAGNAGWEDARLQDCLESALNIVWNELKYTCTVHKDYAVLAPMRCIPSQLSQVFMNLLMNAAQAIETRGDIFIRTAVDEPGWVTVTVRDTGSGIAPEHLKHVFDPFFTTKPVGKGTGLGLSLVWGIVERHQGRITVDSVLGQGSTFSLHLPLNLTGGDFPPGETTAAQDPAG